MTSANIVVLAGNLTRDPELQQTSSQKSVCEFGLATNESYTNRNGEKVERACFTQIVTWNKQAEVCAEHLSKGAPVLVEGRLHYDSWETNEGQKRSTIKVWANRVHFLGRPKPAPEPEQAAESVPF